MSEQNSEWTIEEGYCPKREDETHCVHWWDGEKCCSCGHSGDEEKANED